MHKNLPDVEKTRARSRIGVAVLAVEGSPVALSKVQKRFNQLIEKLKGQRDELQRWQAYQRFYQQQLNDTYLPMVVRLREQRMAMAEVLDRAMDGKELGKQERDKARYLLNQLLGGLLASSEDANLVRLHDKYAAATFAELRQDRMDALRAVANEALEIDVDAYTGAEAPEEFETWLEEQIRASRAEPAAAPAAKRKTARSIKKDALREQIADGGTRAVREAYRKLVSELHPDRESDPVQQERKTEMMQRVNQAYKAGDLLGLLELQLSIEQIDSAALAGLAEDRLRHYVHVLEEQSRQLRDELSELIEPFVVALNVATPRRVTIDAVQRVLANDIRELKTVLRKVEMDLICFRDIRQLKQSLRHHDVEPLDDEDLDMLDDRPFARRGRR